MAALLEVMNVSKNFSGLRAVADVSFKVPEGSIFAVIGPNADQWGMLLGNYNGLPSDPVTPLRGMREAVSKSTRVLYARGSDLADGDAVSNHDASTSHLIALAKTR